MNTQEMEAIEDQIRREGDDPHRFFIVGEGDDATVMSYSEDGEMHVMFMSDERAEQLKAYLKARRRVFKTLSDAKAGFRWVKGR